MFQVLSLVVCLFLLVPTAFAGWTHSFQQVQTESRGRLLRPVVHGGTVHIPFHDDGNVRGFALDGGTKYAQSMRVMTSNEFDNRLSIHTVVTLQGGGDVVMRLTDGWQRRLIRLRADGSVVWSLSQNQIGLLDSFDAFRLPNDDVLIAQDTSVHRIAPNGRILDAKAISIVGESPKPKFDVSGRLLAQLTTNVLSHLDPATLESTNAWTRLSDRLRAMAPARDGGAVLLTQRGLSKTSPSGATQWTVPLPGLVNWTSGVENRIVELSNGTWLIYEGPGNPSDTNLYGVSAAGSLLFHRMASRSEARSVSADGSVFLGPRSGVYSLDPVTGGAAVMSAIDASDVDAMAVVGADLILVGTATPQGEAPFVRRVTTGGEVVWQSSTLLTPAPTMTGNYEHVFCEGARLRGVGSSYDVSVVKLKYPTTSNPIVSETYSTQRISDAGAFVSASTNSNNNHCIPARDAEGTEYWLDQSAGQLHAMRSDGTTKWRADVSELSASTSKPLRTVLVGADSVAAEYGRQLRLHDRATGALRWVTYSGVYERSGRFDGAGVGWSADVLSGLLRISQTGVVEQINAQLSAGTNLLPLRAGGVIAVKARQAMKYAADGSLQWTLDIGIANYGIYGSSQLFEAANGDIVVAGSEYSLVGSGQRGFFARILPGGTMRHRVSITSFAGSGVEPTSHTVSAVAERPNGELVIGLDNDTPGSLAPSMLRTYDLNGTERARFVEPFRSLTGLQNFRFSDILTDSNGAVALGYGYDAVKALPSAFLIKIDSLEVTTAQLRLLSALPTNSRYDIPFDVTVGLRTPLGDVVTATRPVIVRVTREATGGMVSDGVCTIEIGQSQCTFSSIRAHPAGPTGPVTARLRISADGYGTLVSAAFAVSPAPTNVSITILSSQPLRALSEMRYSIDVTAQNSLEDASVFVATPGGCIAISTPNSVRRFRCSAPVRAPSASFSYAFASSTGAYQSSSGSLTASVARSPIQISLLPTVPSNVKAGALFSVEAVILLPDGKDVWPNTGGISLKNGANAVLCASLPMSANNGDTATGFHRCTTRETRVGSDPLALVVDATDQILGATLSIPLVVTAAYGIEGSLFLPIAGQIPDFCFVPPGPSCNTSVLETTTARFDCVAPPNWRGLLYVKQVGQRYRVEANPIGPLTAVEQPSVYWMGTSTLCTPDVNGDGSVDLDLDGVLILKRLFAMDTDADYLSLAHSCASASYAQATSRIDQAIQSLDWDFDGDGKVLPLTDGLLLLRMMLGLQGTSLTEGAIDPSGTRIDASSIYGFAISRCGSALRN